MGETSGSDSKSGKKSISASGVRDAMGSKERLEVHEHCFTSGPRAYRTGNWPAGMGNNFSHSHEGGSVPHEHPDTGPAAYRRGKKLTARPNGEQFPLIPSEPQFFDVYVLDSALAHDNDGNLVPIGDREVSGPGMQGELLQRKFGLIARVHDLRTQRRA